jgi:transcriptional regulator with XRE-family HTH domain
MHRNSDVVARQYPDIGERRLKSLLSECSLTGAELARRVDVHPNTVSAWMTGSRSIPGAVIAYLTLLAEVKRLSS